MNILLASECLIIYLLSQIFILSFPNETAISLALDPSFNEDQDILVLPLDLLKYDTHAKLAQDVLNHFGKVT